MTTLSVCFPLKNGWRETQEKVEKAVGRHCDDSGAGFGLRDLAWRFTFRIDAGEAEDRVKALLIEGVETDVRYD